MWQDKTWWINTLNLTELSHFDLLPVSLTGHAQPEAKVQEKPTDAEIKVLCTYGAESREEEGGERLWKGKEKLPSTLCLLMSTELHQHLKLSEERLPKSKSVF